MKNVLFLLPVSLLLSSCGNEEIETYRIPKEPPAPSPSVQASAAPVAPAPADNGFEVQLPDGWTEKQGTGMRMVSYTIKDTAIDFYLISLTMGDVTSNVNRWRGQVGLAPASPEQIEADLELFQADGHELKYIEIYNEDGGKGIVAAIVDLSPHYWYFTAKGSVDELKANVSDIRLFLKSLKIQ